MPSRLALRSAFLLLTVALWPLAAGAQGGDPDERDLQALRFYMAENNEQAIQSELRRLQIQFPAWTPPEDLGALQQDVPAGVVDRIYQLIAQEDYQGARDEIRKTSSDYPSWSPSTELLTTLSLAEAQTEFNDAVEAGNRQAVIRIARATPTLLRCERVNNAWQLAEQYQALGDAAAAMIVYNGVAASCTDPDVLIATLEKSAAVATVSELAELADGMRAKSPGMAERLTTVENRLRAGLNAAPRAIPGVASLPVPATTILPGTATVESDADLTTRPHARPSGLGTTKVVRSTPRASSGSSGVADGSVSSSLARAASSGDWNTCLALTRTATQAAAVSQRGWCAFNAGRPMQALRDFRAATKGAGSATLRRDSAYGMALTMLRLKMVNDAATVAASTDFTRDQRLEIESEILDFRGVAAYDRKDYLRAIGYFNELERLTGRLRRDLAMLRGYAYMNSGQRGKAAAEFQRLHDQLATPQTRAALSAALR